MKILFYTDLHAKDQNPRSRTGSYRDDILKKLHEIIHLAQKHEVDYLVNGADTFDQKSSWRTSHLLVQEMIDIMRAWPGDRHLTVIGTHDVPTGQLSKLHQQPLGVLESSGVIHVMGLPPNNIINFHDVIFHGVHASYNLDTNPDFYAVRFEKKPDKPVVTIAHGMIVPPGQEFFGDYTQADSIDTDADVILYGHPHTPDGMYECESELGKTLFVGPGSVARLGSYPYNRSRIPQVALLDWPDGQKLESVEWIPLSTARPPEEVFAEVIADEADENEVAERVATFVETLRSANIAEDSWGIDELRLELRSMDVPDPVKVYSEEILDFVA